MTLQSVLPWVAGILGIAAPVFTYYRNCVPPLFPDIWIILTIVSAVLLYIVASGPALLPEKPDKPPRPERQALRLIGIAVACIAVYAVLLDLWTVVDPQNQEARFQIGFGTPPWSLTELGRDLARKLPNASSQSLMLADAAYRPGGPEEIWRWWTIVTAGSILIALYGLSSLSWTVGFGLLARRLEGANSAPPGEAVQAHVKRVFISYNHADSAAAQRIAALLRQHAIEVTIDTDSMAAGESIDDFIVRCLREADTVLVIISSHSLLSGWVAVETMKRLDQQQWDREKLLIGGRLDDEVLQPDFRLKATEQIDKRLHEIDLLIAKYAEEKLDPVDLNHERTRWHDLRNNLGPILAKLRGSRMIDLREKESDQELLSAVLPQAGSHSH